jgi:hypothetical protein
MGTRISEQPFIVKPKITSNPFNLVGIKSLGDLRISKLGRRILDTHSKDRRRDRNILATEDVWYKDSLSANT